MRGKVIHQIIPHLRIMFMLLLTLPGKVRDRERPTRLKHKRDRVLRDLHHGWRFRRCSFELLIRDAVRHHPALERHAAGLELVGAAAVCTVDEAHEFGSCVAMVVGWPVSV